MFDTICIFTKKFLTCSVFFDCRGIWTSCYRRFWKSIIKHYFNFLLQGQLSFSLSQKLVKIIQKIAHLLLTNQVFSWYLQKLQKLLLKISFLEHFFCWEANWTRLEFSERGAFERSLSLKKDFFRKIELKNHTLAISYSKQRKFFWFSGKKTFSKIIYANNYKIVMNIAAVIAYGTVQKSKHESEYHAKIFLILYLYRQFSCLPCLLKFQYHSSALSGFLLTNLLLSFLLIQKKPLRLLSVLS